MTLFIFFIAIIPLQLIV